MRTEHHTFLRESLHKFKQRHCDDCDADDPPILHREDVLGRRTGFKRLSDYDKAAEFYSAFIDVVKGIDCVVFSVVVDKFTHGKKLHRRVTNPYHYCFYVLLEKYLRYLNSVKAIGDVLAESRGSKEDNLLQDEYSRVISRGTYYFTGSDYRQRFTSSKMKFKKKEANVAGLQVADMVAFGATRDTLSEYRRCSLAKLGYFDKLVIKTLTSKYYQCPVSLRARGWGKVILG